MVLAIVTTLALAGLLVLRVTWWRVPHEDDPIPPIPQPIDPIELAYARRGPGDAVRVSAVALAARGIVRIEGERLALTGLPLATRDDPFANAIYDGLRWWCRPWSRAGLRTGTSRVPTRTTIAS